MEQEMWIFFGVVIILVLLFVWRCGGTHDYTHETSEAFPRLDLHGVHVRDVEDLVEQFLSKNRNVDKVQIITGQGLHSLDGIPRIKPIVINYLNRNKYSYHERKDGGSLYVNL